MMAADTLVRRARPWLGTIVEIAVPARCEAMVEAGFARIAHVHARMSYHDAGSDLERMRGAAVGAIVAVDPETVAVLRVAATLHLETDGLFDVTVGRRLVASGFLPHRGNRHLGGVTGTAADIEILDDSHVCCHAPLLIDLGGIAKGHGVDLAVGALITAGCPNAIVNAGGDLRVFGDVPQQIWLRGANGELAQSLMVTNGAVATSSNRHMRRRNRRLLTTPHIGRGGMPIIIEHAVTVTAPTCIIADALTKVAIADPALAETWLAQHGGAMITVQPCRNVA